MDGRFRWWRIELTDGWPGLVRLWYGGLSSGLGLAVVFTILLNATLLAVCVWPAVVPPVVRHSLLLATIAAWVAGWIDARFVRRQQDLGRQQDAQLDLFLSARGEYLKSNWSAAERLLGQLLRETPSDVEARLMLATLLRHARRLAEAKEQLRRLQRWSRASAWNLEIRHEWEHLSRLECSTEWADTEVLDETTGSIDQEGREEAA